MQTLHLCKNKKLSLQEIFSNEKTLLTFSIEFYYYKILLGTNAVCSMFSAK